MKYSEEYIIEYLEFMNLQRLLELEEFVILNKIYIITKNNNKLEMIDNEKSYK